MYRHIRFFAVFALLAACGGCSALHEWLNKEPEFMTRPAPSPEETARRHGIAADLNDTEYAELEKIKQEQLHDRRKRDRELIGY